MSAPRCFFLNIFCKSIVESAVCFAAIYWGSSIRARNSKKLNYDKEGWLCAGDCNGAPGHDYKNKNAAQVNEHKEQHYSSSLKHECDQSEREHRKIQPVLPASRNLS